MVPVEGVRGVDVVPGDRGAGVRAGGLAPRAVVGRSEGEDELVGAHDIAGKLLVPRALVRLGYLGQPQAQAKPV